MSSLFGPSPAGAKQTLLDAVRKHGASRLEAHYSGGHDEGGVDGIKLFDADGKELPEPEFYIKRKPTEEEKRDSWREQDEDGMIQDESPIYRAADEMLSTEFGSWAGEFSAYGTLFADLKENRVWRDGETTSGYTADKAEY